LPYLHPQEVFPHPQAHQLLYAYNYQIKTTSSTINYCPGYTVLTYALPLTFQHHKINEDTLVFFLYFSTPGPSGVKYQIFPATRKNIAILDIDLKYFPATQALSAPLIFFCNG